MERKGVFLLFAGLIFLLFFLGYNFQSMGQLCELPGNTGLVTRIQYNIFNVYGTSIAWDGSAYGVVWADITAGSGYLRYSRLAADGTILINSRIVSPQYDQKSNPDIVWTGTEYGVVWEDARNGNSDIYFARVNVAGISIIGDVLISSDPTDQNNPQILWTGSEYAITWDDARDGDFNIYFARVDSDGTKIGDDIRLTDQSYDERFPSIQWTGLEYGLAWQTLLPGNYEIYFALYDSDGSLASNYTRITNQAAEQIFPTMKWSGKEFGLSWEDGRNSYRDIYFCRIDAGGRKQTGDIRVTTNNSGHFYPSLAWTGEEYGILWTDDRSGNLDLFFARIDQSGVKLSSDIKISSGSAHEFSSPHSLAFGTRGYGIAWEMQNPDEVIFYQLGCHADSTAPSCPQSPHETGRTPTSVSLQWGPGIDPETEIAYYLVYKNQALINNGPLTTLGWTDSNFDPTDGTEYYIETVNAKRLYSANCDIIDTTDSNAPACPGDFFTTEVLSSSVSLSWSSVSDDLSGLKRYNIYRNNSFLNFVDAGTEQFTDSSVLQNIVYSFRIVPEDYAGNRHTGCETLELFTGPIQLLITKNADAINADLAWTDVGIHDYVVYRSSSPQDYIELKHTSFNSTSDPVLNDGTPIWYYHIQQKGL